MLAAVPTDGGFALWWYMKLVHGFGVNDADYKVSPVKNGKQVWCPAYSAWSSMIRRCYSKKSLLRFNTYAGVSVCEEWRSFMKFKSWWDGNYVKGWHLDKDIISEDRVYSPTSCVYVPAWLNSFTVSCALSRGEFPIGVSFNRFAKKFSATCRNPISDTIETIGYFSCPSEAHNAWRSRKIEIALELKPVMDKIDKRLYEGILRIINNAK